MATSFLCFPLCGLSVFFYCNFNCDDLPIIHTILNEMKYFVVTGKYSKINSKPTFIEEQQHSLTNVGSTNNQEETLSFVY